MMTRMEEKYILGYPRIQSSHHFILGLQNVGHLADDANVRIFFGFRTDFQPARPADVRGGVLHDLQ